MLNNRKIGHYTSDRFSFYNGICIYYNRKQFKNQIMLIKYGIDKSKY